jgi:hypothetical protein
MTTKINDLIAQYAKLYQDFEKLQDEEVKILPKGDQKTGVIGDYFIFALSSFFLYYWCDLRNMPLFLNLILSISVRSIYHSSPI